MARSATKPKPTGHAVAKARNGFRSLAEESVAKQLTKLKIPFRYEPADGLLEYTIPATRHKYLPDFILPNNIYVEVKGYWEPASRKKMLLVISQHPDKDIRMAFMDPSVKISKGSKTTYAMWCQRHGIRYGTVADIKRWAQE